MYTKIEWTLSGVGQQYRRSWTKYNNTGEFAKVQLQPGKLLLSRSAYGVFRMPSFSSEVFVLVLSKEDCLENVGAESRRTRQIWS